MLRDVDQVEDFDDHWHFGSDMARFIPCALDNASISKCWAVCVDLTEPSKAWCDVTFLWIIPGAQFADRWIVDLHSICWCGMGPYDLWMLR